MSGIFILTSSSSSISNSITDATKKVAEASKEPISIDWRSIVTNFVDGIPEFFNILIKVGISILIFVLARKLIRVLRKPIRKMLSRTQAEAGVRQLIEQLIVFVLYIIVFCIIMGIFGIAGVLSGLLTAIGLIVAFAMQGSLSNFAGGLLIIMQKPFQVGDYIHEDTKGNEGIVEEITLGYTKLKTADQKVIILPNGNLSNTSVINFSRNHVMAVNISIPLHFHADYEGISGKVREVLEKDPARVPDRGVSTFIKELNGSGIIAAYRMYVNVENYWTASSRINEAIRKILLEEQITTPRSEVDVMIHPEEIQKITENPGEAS